MTDTRMGQVWMWVIAGVLVLLLALSFTGNGTMFGGMSMGGMMFGGVFLLALALYVAYRFGRLEQQVEEARKK